MENFALYTTNRTRPICKPVYFTEDEWLSVATKMAESDMLKQLQQKGSCKAWFLSGNESKPVEPRCYRKSLRCYLKSAGVTVVNPHALRHTFATTCLQAGCNIKTLSELLGHASSDITLKRYVHTCWEWKQNEMNRIFQ